MDASIYIEQFELDIKLIFCVNPVLGDTSFCQLYYEAQSSCYFVTIINIISMCPNSNCLAPMIRVLP